MDRKDQRLTAAGLLVAAALVLSACGEDEPTPRVENRPSAAETTPAALEETAEEFIRRWNDVLNAMQGGDTAEWRAMTPECDGCARSADVIDEIYENGGYVKTKGTRVLSVRRTKESRGADTYVYVVRTDSEPTELQRSAGSEPEKLAGGAGEIHVKLEKRSGGWNFVDMWQVAS